MKPAEIFMIGLTLVILSHVSGLLAQKYFLPCGDSCRSAVIRTAEENETFIDGLLIDLEMQKRYHAEKQQ